MIKVVVVEDESFIRRGMVLATPWEDFGCEVIGEAKDGEEGYELIMKLQPDLVITDVHMPVVDGIEMIKKLEGEVEVEWIIISGYDDFAYAQQAIKLGVKDYLLKPIEDEEFYSTLRNVIQLIVEKQKAETLEEKQRMLEEGKAELVLETTFDQTVDGRRRYVTQAIACIEDRFRESISISEVADELEISESYLSRLFKTYTGYTFVEYLTDHRIKKAIELMKDRRLKIYEVAEQVGYQDAKYFSILFKKKMGVTPMTFKNHIGEKSV